MVLQKCKASILRSKAFGPDGVDYGARLLEELLQRCTENVRE